MTITNEIFRKRRKGCKKPHDCGSLQAGKTARTVECTCGLHLVINVPTPSAAVCRISYCRPGCRALARWRRKLPGFGHELFLPEVAPEELV